MGDSRQPWPPYATTKDCSLGFCSIYCPQYCYFLFPPPPLSTSSSSSSSSNSSSGPTLSPLLIAIIAVLATAFLLITYYTVLSKFRRYFQNLNPSPPSPSSSDGLTAWHASPSDGLDESLINRITVYKYQAGDAGLAAVGSTDCSVCLAEFQDGESLRLLPKCGHAFHLPCIDAWLKSHSSCPLCRASIVPPANPSPPQLATVQQHLGGDRTDEMVAAGEESEQGSSSGDGLGGGLTEETGIEVREDGIMRPIQRSFSMDSSFLRRVSIAGDMGSSRWSRALHSVASPARMKRSFSGGRLSFVRNGRGRSAVLPI